MIDDVDGVSDCFDYFQTQNENCQSAIWNGRNVDVLPQHTSLSCKLFQFPEQPQPFPHVVEQIDIEEDEASDFVFAPCSFRDHLTLGDPLPAEIVLSKSFFHRLWHEAKKGVKKVANAAKRVLKAIAHGTKKAAKTAEEFVKDHKKEILIATAIIGAVSGAFLVSGLLASGAAAAAPSPRKKEDQEGDSIAASPPAPAAPPPLPDWVQDVLKSTAADLSPLTAADSELDNAKREAHNAWETLNHLKKLTEADLAHLRKEDPKFDPSSTAIQTILNTVLSDAQRNEFSRTSSAQQNWQNLIQSGHERIDHAFSEVSAHKVAVAAIALPPQPPAFNFVDKIKLGLEIIGRSMMEPELLDSNTRLDTFLKDRNLAVPLENPTQTVSEFVTKIKSGLETIGRSLIAQEILDPNSPLDIFLEHQNAESLGANPTQSISQFFSDLRQKRIFENVQIKTGDLTLLDTTRSEYYKIDGLSQKEMRITLVNGMLCGKEDSFEHGKYVQKLCPSNLSIDLIHNKTNGPLDVLEAAFLNFSGYSPITQNLLMKQWMEFHEQNKDSPNAKILHFCHSQGAIHTNNALMKLPEEIRKRVIVVAIAPAEIVPNMLCHESFNYASETDPIPKAQLFAGYWRACCFLDFSLITEALKKRDELILLKPHEGATGINHDFQSPTFTDRIITHLADYHNKQGKYQ